MIEHQKAPDVKKLLRRQAEEMKIQRRVRVGEIISGCDGDHEDDELPDNDSDL